MENFKNRTLFVLFRTFIIRSTLALLYRFRIHGKEHVPKDGPVILVCKHQSWVDLFAVSEIVGHQMNYVAKRELFENLFGDYKGSLLEKIGQLLLPFTSGGLRGMGAIPIDRDHPEKMVSSFKLVRELLINGEFLVFYPEGRTIPDTMGEFKTGMIKLLVKMQRKLPKPAVFLPVGISYGKKKSLRKELVVKIGEPIAFTGDEADASDILKDRIEKLTDFTL